MSDKEKVRAFIALELSETDRQALRELQEDLRGAGEEVRWVAPESLHLTLQFLGDVPEDRILEIERALEAIAVKHKPFVLTLQGAGAFPNLRRPQTIWAGCSENGDPVQPLAEDVNLAMSELGYPPDKPFRPHITLGRARDRKGARGLSDLLQQNANRPLSVSPVELITLFKSDLRPGGPVYTPLARIRIGRR